MLDRDHIVNLDISINQSIEALNKLTINGKYPLLIIVDNEDKLKATLTDGDIRRFLLRKPDLQSKAIDAAKLNPFHLSLEDERNKKDLLYYKVIPVVDDQFKVMEVLSSKLLSNQSLVGIPVIINAGGVGSRLYPYTQILPKPLIPINEKPIIDHIINSFVKHGIDSFRIVLNYKRQLIRSYLEDTWINVNFDYIEEEKALGTLGGLSLINSSHLNYPFFILSNCDVLIDYDFEKITSFHEKNGYDMTIVSVIMENRIPYGVLEIDSNNLLSKITEKPHQNVLINSGIYLINSKLLDMLETNQHLDMDTFILKCLQLGKAIGVYPISNSNWYDMGTLDGLARMQEHLT
jgi:dTDP-glucose pyrophosphorylase